ncbi:MAG: LamG-like jellyroll fold domain-containing protein [Bacteroidota bacterium]
MGTRNNLISKVLLLCVLVQLGIPLALYSQGEDVFNFVWKQDFNNSPLGLYTREQVNKDWNNPNWAAGTDKTYIVDLYGDRAMKFNIPPGTTNSWDGGGEWWAPLPPGHEEMYFSYNVMFRPGFDWVLGGKLPGLGGVDNPTGGIEMPFEAGFTARYMWTEVKESDPNYPDGKFIFYVYHHNKSGKYGDAIALGETTYPVDDSIWHNLCMRVVLNTVYADGGAADGLIEFFLDGKHITTRYGLKYRNLSSIWIDTQHIVTFFGGSGDEYAPTVNEWMLFDDFACFTFKDGVDVVRGKTATPSGTTIPIPNSKHGMKPAPSAVEVETDQEPPTAPTGLQPLFISGAFIGFMWLPSTDNKAVKGYTVYQDGVEKFNQEATSAVLLGLESQTNYSISITAFDEAGNISAPSQPMQILTTDPDTEAPSIPQNLRSVSQKQSSIDVIWDPSTDDVAVKEYEVYVNRTRVGFPVAASYSVIGLNPSTEYRISVLAVDMADNSSSATEEITVRTLDLDLEAPSIPQGLTTTLITQNSIGLAWGNSTDNVGLAGYNIDVNGVRKGSSITNSFSVTGLNPGITYQIAVSAYDESYNESPPGLLTAVTQNPDVTSTPSLPRVLIEGVSSEENKSRTTSNIDAFGHTELQDYGLAISTENNFLGQKQVVYANREDSHIWLEGRVAGGLQVLYQFDEQEGELIRNQAPNGVGDEANLVIGDPLETFWLPGKGLKVTGNTIIASEGPPGTLLDRISQSNELSLELWIRPEQINQSGPARLLTISKDYLTRAATLGHEGNQALFNYIARLTTETSDDKNGLPQVTTTEDFISLNLHHVVYTRNSGGGEKIYVNGVERFRGTRDGDLDFSGEDFLISIANEISGDRPWHGTYYLAAVYDKALTMEEVKQNLDQGVGEIQYTTSLSNLEPNVTYYMAAFARTDQGIVYGDTETLTLGNVNYSSVEDSLYIAIYPNPGNGEFTLNVQCGLKEHEPAFLRISDINGSILFNEALELTECGVIRYPYVFSEESYLMNGSGVMEFQFNLSSFLNEGIYSVMLIAGDTKVATRLVVMNP